MQLPIPGWVLLALSAFLVWRTAPTQNAVELLSPRREWLWFGLILALGIFLRLWNLRQLPPGCWFDEAENGLETLGVMAGKYPAFTSQNNGRGALQFYWAAPFFRIFGANIFTLRLSVATLGILTVPAVWRLFRKTNGPFIGLAASAFVAFSVWHITESRAGFDSVLTPLADLLIITAVLKALETKKYFWFALSGFLVGLANYGYVASRLSVLLAAILFWRLWPQADPERRQVMRGTVLAGAVLLLTLLPLVLHFVNSPDDLSKREGQVTVFSAVVRQKSLKPLAKTTLATLRMFFERGDQNARSNLPGAPHLDIISGLMFFLGFVLLLRNPKTPWTVFLLAWLLLPLFAGGALTEPAPHGLRTLAALMPAGCIAAYGLETLLGTLPLPRKKRWFFGGALLALVALAAYRQYFQAYPRHPAIRAAFASQAYAVGEYVKTLPPDAPLWLSPNISPSVVKFMAHQPARKINLFDPSLPVVPGAFYILTNPVEAAPVIREQPRHWALVRLDGEQFIVCMPK